MTQMWHRLQSVSLFGLVLTTSFAALAEPTESQLRSALQAKTGTVTLPKGTIEISREIILPSDAHDLDIKGDATILKAAAAFRGRALLVIPAGKNIKIENLSLDGNRDAVAKPIGLPPSESMFSTFEPNNGILAEGVTNLEISHVTAVAMAGFTILVNAGHTVHIHDVRISNSGSLNARKRNNATGGILLEEGTTDFEILNCRIADVRGNGIWTHSLGNSARNARGRVAGNEFAMIARDAIQIGNATDVRVESNRGRMIGYDIDEVDRESRAYPVAIATAGNVDKSVYRNNQFEEINGKCFDLDGFHDGEVAGNSCVNEDEAGSYPFGNIVMVMSGGNNIRINGNTLDGGNFGGIFVVGTGHIVSGNHLHHLNKLHCNDSGVRQCNSAANEPDLFRSGIYLGSGAKGNTIDANEISGYGMSRYCIAAAPGTSLAANTVAKNDCSDDAAIARVLFGTQH